MGELIKKLSKLQAEITVSKTKFNNFGRYHYRTVEDIYKKLKPLLEKYGLFLILSDEIVQIGERFYIKAKAGISDGEDTIVSYGYAREPDIKKGMDPAQITGASSSYARKYALAGLFLLDDNQDPDESNQPPSPSNQSKPTPTPTPTPTLTQQEEKQTTQQQKVSDWKQKFINTINKLIAEKNIPLKAVEMVCILEAGCKTPMEVGDREAAMKIYNTLKTANVETLEKVEQEIKNIF